MVFFGNLIFWINAPSTYYTAIQMDLISMGHRLFKDRV
jgi:hypothetical protein